MSWDEICATILRGDLDDLKRHPRCEKAYFDWAPAIRAAHGGLENYIRKVRLGWPVEGPSAHLPLLANEVPSGATTPNGTKVKETWPETVLPNPNGDGTLLRNFVGHLDSELIVKCIPNDWPYAIPPDAQHWVVWSKLPILHPALFQTPDTPFDDPDLTLRLFDAVTSDGVRGLTGQQGNEIPTVYGPNTYQLLQQDGTDITTENASKAQWWAGRHIRTYIHARWHPDHYETAWFCNPPNLRTVPGLSHFHVIVRCKRT